MPRKDPENRAQYSKEYSERNKEKLAAYRKAYREKNREQLLAAKKAYWATNRDKLCEQLRERYTENPEYWREYSRKQYAKNPEKAREYSRQYRNKHAEAVKIAKKAYRAMNKDVINAAVARRKANKLRQTPKWVTSEELWLIKEVYAIAAIRTEQTGFVWHVDHVIPLQGKIVSGLHVPENLQVIPAIVNIKKKNKYEVAHGY